MRVFRLLAVVVVALAMIVPAMADNITGKVVVIILDETNAPFPGVIVTLTNARGISAPLSVQTNIEGKAVFGVVQAGAGYKVTIEVPGYAKIEEENLAVRPGQPLQLLYKMSPEKVETVRVTESRPLSDLDEPTGTTSISGEFFQDLPIQGRNYQSALTLAPGVQDSDGDGNPNVHGSRERDFKASLDGISNVDPLTGTFMSNINPDAIEEIEVVTEGADASYGGAVGGFASIITKQGSNEFEGVFRMIYRSDVLDGNGAQPEPADQFKFNWYQPSISLTGKIIRDKLFFAANHDYTDIGSPVALQSGSNVTITTQGWRHLDKLTWQVTPRNKLNFQYSADPLTVKPLSNFGGFSSLASLDSAFRYEQGGPTYSTEWQVQLNPSFTVKTIVGFSDTGIGFFRETSGVLNSCVVDSLSKTNIGKEFARPGQGLDFDYCISSDTGRISGSYNRNHDDKRQRLTVKSDATAFVNNFLGKEHTIDFGIVGEDVHYEAEDQYYPFSLLQTGRGGFSDQGGGTIGLNLDGDFIRTTYSPEAPGFLHREADGRRYGVYVQDTFRPHPRVSIKAGLRLDREEITAPGYELFDPSEERKRFFQDYNRCLQPIPGIEQTCTRVAMRNFVGFEDLPNDSSLALYNQQNGGPVRARRRDTINLSNNNLAPRISVSWDPKGDGLTKIFTTYSKYYGETFLGVPATEQGPFSFVNLFTARDGNRIDDLAPNSISPPTVSYVDRGLRTPYANEFTFGVTREIFSETSLSFTYIRRTFVDQFQDIDINHQAQDLGDNSLDCVLDPFTQEQVPQGKPDGRFDDCGGLRVRVPSGNLGGGAIVDLPDGIPDLALNNPFFNQVFLVGNFNQEKYTAYQLELRRRLHHNWEMDASYVYSRALGQAEDYLQAVGDDPTTIQDEKGFLGYDQRHVVKVNARTLLPVWGLRLGFLASWESGLPYSLVSVQTSDDRTRNFGVYAGSYQQVRTLYPTGRRNDHRNDGIWNLDVRLERDFQIGKVTVAGAAEVFNVFNDDSRVAFGVRNGAEDSIRRFGREFQMSAKVNF